MEQSGAPTQTTASRTERPTPLGLGTLDRELRFLEVNATLAAINGVAAGDHIGRTLAEVLPTFAPVITPLLQQVLATGAPLEDIVLVGETPATAPGRGRYRASYYPIRTRSGLVIGIELVVQPIAPPQSRPSDPSLPELLVHDTLFRSIYDQATVGILITALDGQILHANPGFCALTGYTLDEVLQLTYAALAHPDDQVADQAMAGPVLNGSVPGESHELRYLRRDGAALAVQVTRSLVRNGDGTPRYVLALIQDRSARVRAEAQLEYRLDWTTRLRNLALDLAAALTPEQVAELILRHSLAATGATGGAVRQLSGDGEALEILYLAARDLAAMAQWDRIPLDSALPVTDAVACGEIILLESRAAILARYPHLAETVAELGHHAFAALPLRVDGTAIGTFSLWFDSAHAFDEEERAWLAICARQCGEALARATVYRAEQRAREEAELARREAEQALVLLDAVYDTAPIGLAFLNRDLRFVRINETLAAMNRVSAAAHLGRTASELAPAAAAVLEPLWRSVLETGTPVVDRELTIDDDGRPLTLLASYYPVRGRDDELIGLGAVVNDITARVRAAKESQLLATITATLSESLDYRERLQGFARQLVPALADWCLVDEVGADGKIARVAIVADTAEREAILRTIAAHYPPDWDAPHPVVDAMRQRAPVLIAEVTEDWLAAKTVDAPQRELVGALGMRSGVVLPLIARGALLGAVSLTSVRPGRYGPDDLPLLEELARRAALAVENARLYQETRAAHRRSDESLALLDTIFTNAPTGLAFIDQGYRYVRINEALAAMNGRTVAEHLGRTVRELLPELAPHVEPMFAHVLSSGEPFVGVEIAEAHAAAPGGQRVWEASYYPVRLADGKIAGIGVVANDVTESRRAVEALRQSEERFRVALEHARILVYTTDRALRYTWIYNPHPAFRPEETLGRRDEELTTAEVAAKLTAIKQGVLDAGVGRRQEVTLAVGGETRSYDLSVEPLHDGAGAVVGLTVAAIDITEHLAADQARRESEARARVLTEAVPAILFRSRADGSTEYMSQGYYAYTGASPKSPHDDWAAHTHPDDLPGVRERWREAAATATPFDVEYRLRRADGVFRWFRGRSIPVRDEAGGIAFWVGVAVDVDDARRAAAEREELLAREQAARAAAERSASQIAQLLEATAALSQALTPQAAAAVIVSQATRALGAASATLRLISADGRTLDALDASGVPDEVAAPWERTPLDAVMPITSVARSGEPLFFGTYAELLAAYPQLEPTIPPLSFAALAIVPLNVEGRTIGTLTLTFAAPRSFSAEERNVLLALAGQGAQAIERARLYLAEAEAVQVRDSFIAVASHDLRNPITVLQGQAQLFQRRAAREGVNERLVRSAEVIAEQASRLDRMVGALLDLSRIQMGRISIDLQPMDLAALVTRIIGEFEPTLTRHEIVLAHAEGPLLIRGDELRLEQVLHNLLGNAVKYSPDGGTVRVTLGRRGADVFVEVADEGLGIPAEALPRLFERFYRAATSANSTISGLGVGLYVVREIVALHGGTVSVTSTEGAGSTFVVRLPAA